MEVKIAEENDGDTLTPEENWMCSGVTAPRKKILGLGPIRRYKPQVSHFKLFVEILFAGLIIGFLAYGLSVFSQRSWFRVEIETLFFLAYACYIWGYVSGYESREKENQDDQEEY